MSKRAGSPFDRIVSDPRRLGGQPCIRGTRITVRRVIGLLAFYRTRAGLFQEYPQLSDSDLDQALRFAAANLGDDRGAAGQQRSCRLTPVSR